MPWDGFGSFAFAAEFASKHGRTKQSVLNRMARLRGVGCYTPEAEERERVDKKCLKCRKPIRVERQIFICSDCKQLDVFRSDGSGTSLSLRHFDFDGFNLL